MAVDLKAKDAYEGPEALEDLAGVYTRVGRHEEALDLIERLLDMTYKNPLTLKRLELDSSWDPLRENARFRDLFGPS